MAFLIAMHTEVSVIVARSSIWRTESGEQLLKLITHRFKVSLNTAVSDNYVVV